MSMIFNFEIQSKNTLVLNYMLILLLFLSQSEHFWSVKIKFSTHRVDFGSKLDFLDNFNKSNIYVTVKSMVVDNEFSQNNCMSILFLVGMV